MRLKIFLIIFLLFAIQIVKSEAVLAACLPTTYGACSGYCGVQTITYSTELGYATDSNCPADCSSSPCISMCASYVCFDQGASCSDTSGAYYFPGSGVCCNEVDCLLCQNVGGSNCISETADVLCNCPPVTITPTSNLNPTGVGGGTPNPTATPLIDGRVHLDIDSSLSGSYCSQTTASPLYPAGLELGATGATGTHQASFSFINTGSYSINTVSAGPNYTVTLDLSSQTGSTNYACSCPAPLDPSNPYLCAYYGVTSPSANVNFYLKEYNLSNASWFQVFGGNFFGRDSVISQVPYNFCIADGSCQAALSVSKAGSTNQLSSGMAVTNASNTDSLRSNVSSSLYHSYLHLASRPSNADMKCPTAQTSWSKGSASPARHQIPYNFQFVERSSCWFPLVKGKLLLLERPIQQMCR